MAKLIITREAQLVREVQLAKERTTIGRHAHNDVVIDHRAVSGQHAAITTISGQVVLEDLGSTNGTFVNGRRINKHVLADLDRITLAKFELQFIASRARPAIPPAPVQSAPASVEVMNGFHAGKKLALTKPLTTLGTPGAIVLVISRSAAGYAAARMDGSAAPSVNGIALGAAPHPLAHGDLIDLGGTRMIFSCP